MINNSKNDKKSNQSFKKTQKNVSPEINPYSDAHIDFQLIAKMIKNKASKEEFDAIDPRLFNFMQAMSLNNVSSSQKQKKKVFTKSKSSVYSKVLVTDYLNSLQPNMKNIKSLSKDLKSMTTDVFYFEDLTAYASFINNMGALDTEDFEYFVLKNLDSLSVLEAVSSYFAMNISSVDEEYIAKCVSNEFSDDQYGISIAFEICQKLQNLVEKIDDEKFNANIEDMLEKIKDYWEDFIDYISDDFASIFEGISPKGAKSEKYVDVINYYIDKLKL